MKPTVVLQTDFGNGGGGVMAGVIKSVDPEVPVYDFDHFIEAFNTIAASASLSGAVPYWPSGTVFVSVAASEAPEEYVSCSCIIGGFCGINHVSFSSRMAIICHHPDIMISFHFLTHVHSLL